MDWLACHVGQVYRAAVPPKRLPLQKKMMGHYPLPMVVLARLAVASVGTGQGLDVRLLQDAIRRTL